MLHCCISREFHVSCSRRLRVPSPTGCASCVAKCYEELGGPGVGALGMCMTGNFALALMVDPSVQAPVFVPALAAFSDRERARSRAVHVSPEQLTVIKRRVREDNVKVLGLRFTADRVCTRARFNTLHRELGEGFEEIEIDSGPGNPWGIKRIAHSVLTEELVDDDGHPTKQALDRVLGFFEERLQQAA